jgi:hypothetical protein
MVQAGRPKLAIVHDNGLEFHSQKTSKTGIVLYRFYLHYSALVWFIGVYNLRPSRIEMNINL